MLNPTNELKEPGDVEFETTEEVPVFEQPIVHSDQSVAPTIALNRPSVAEESLSYNQWQVLGNDSFTACSSTSPTLPPAVYKTEIDDRGRLLFQKMKIHSDDLLDFPNSPYGQIITEIEYFWTRERIFKENGFTYKRGYLLYGIQGGGKSSVVNQVAFNLIKRNGLVLICHRPKQLIMALDHIRKVEPERPIVCVYEDIDSIIKEFGDRELLMLLDGEQQFNNVINIATTNYPEELQKRIKARPRRFDRVLLIGLPTPDMRKVYLEKKLGVEHKDLNKWVEITEGLTFAAMAELMISVVCLEKDLEETAKLLKSLDKKISSDQYEKSSIGFAK